MNGAFFVAVHEKLLMSCLRNISQRKSPSLAVCVALGAYGGSSASTAEVYGKNREADMCNPNLNFNIYHTIDEEKVSKSVEHLYDEIKHKNTRDFGEVSSFVSASTSSSYIL